jgi:predicted anti-sigma-YlaC factor YlaD
MSPCWHMRALLTARADQRLSGLIKSYVELHLSQCAQCRAALESLLALRERLIALRSAPSTPLSPERQEQINAALSELIQRHKAPPEK